MEAFPLSWPLAGRRVVLFGDGPFAARKRALLEKTPAEIAAFPRAGAGAAAALRGAAFAVVAIEDAGEAEAAAALARAAGAPVNVVDRPDLSDFHIPAIVDRGELIIAVASGGIAPALVRDVRARIESAVPASTTALAAFAKAIRPLVRVIRDYDARRKVWECILRGRAGEAARHGDFAAAEAFAKAEIASPGAAGVVHIVGAGPGDPELLTLKALRLLQDADVIVHDRLVDRRILDMARRDADFVYVGKEGARERAKHSVPQDQINALLIAEARAGRRVVRLKGGDPFVFGRGGEELDALRAAGVTALVTPGITAALGVAAQALAPLTHRDYAQAVTFITGHAQTGGAPAIDWRALAAANHTLVVYMGAANAAEVAERLIAAGRAADTPALVVENGTRPEERRFATRLDRLAADIARLDLKSPSLLIVGEAAKQAGAAAAILAKAEQAGA
ncbi:MAG: siroheme synthase CysG [Hyphomonadaceae bacterium]